jgi:PTH1 family peptidyl-tRNA hydrolase
MTIPREPKTVEFPKLESPEANSIAVGPSRLDRPAIIIGLGNPGPVYAAHRHNIGFQIVEALARAHGMAFSREKGSKARVATGHIDDRPVVLAKPQTFMNRSGKAVRRLYRAHDIPLERMLVVYDDLDLSLGRVRLRPEGGSGGHKGMRSIIESLGVQAFPRLRVGIDRPPGQMDPAEYVLRPFSEDEKARVIEVVERAVATIECWLTEGITAAMDRFNRSAYNTAPGYQEDQG